MKEYLESSEIIDWKSQEVVSCARHIARSKCGSEEIARSCFEWVRDNVSHSGDEKVETTTVSASEVLRERTGWCFAKSHLLAALLRANEIPAGLCYQRLRRGEDNGFTLHGLNAVYLEDYGWYRIDARGNRLGVDAEFCPPTEKLAWPATHEGEKDYPEIWEDPLPIVVNCLRRNRGWQAVKQNLPDLAPVTTRQNWVPGTDP